MSDGRKTPYVQYGNGESVSQGVGNLNPLIIGEGASDGGFAQATVMGEDAATNGIRATAYGYSSRVGEDSVGIGHFALVDAPRSTVVGRSAGTGAIANEESIVIGYAASATAANQLVIGSTLAPVGAPVTGVGAAGGGDALPASPDLYWTVKVNGTDYKIPLFAV